MALFRMRDAVSSMVDLLDRERRAILSGDLDFLHRILSEKERLTVAIGQSAAVPDIRFIQAKLLRNQSLLRAAADGIADAVNVLKQPMHPHDPHQTYDRAGNRIAPTVVASGAPRRA